MAKTNLGKVGLTPKKAYSASITYERLDFVTAGDSSYVSLQDNNLGHPVTDGAWWQVLASGAASTEAATAALAAAAKALEAAAAAAPVVVNVEGADVTINVEGNHKYICGELTSLKIGTVENRPGLRRSSSHRETLPRNSPGRMTSWTSSATRPRRRIEPTRSISRNSAQSSSSHGSQTKFVEDRRAAQRTRAAGGGELHERVSPITERRTAFRRPANS